MINWFKWISCYVNRKHVFAKYTKFTDSVDTKMVSVLKCVRCGCERTN